MVLIRKFCHEQIFVGNNIWNISECVLQQTWFYLIILAQEKY